MPDPARYMTPAQVAAKLAVNTSKVLSWIRSGALRAVNVAADPKGELPRWRVSPDDLDEFLAGRTATPPPAPVPRSTTRRRAMAGRVWI